MKRLFRRTAWVLFGILISATSANAQQTVRYVSNTDPTCGAQSPCYNSIQAAIDAADQSDVVRILAGTYAEQLHIEKNSYNGAVEADRILLEADPNLQPGQVVLTGNSTGSCTNNYGIRIRRTNFLTIRGLTITGQSRFVRVHSVSAWTSRERN